MTVKCNFPDPLITGKLEAGESIMIPIRLDVVEGEVTEPTDVQAVLVLEGLSAEVLQQVIHLAPGCRQAEVCFPATISHSMKPFEFFKIGVQFFCNHQYIGMRQWRYPVLPA